MIVNMDKFLELQENKYLFTMSAMIAVDKVMKSKLFPEIADAWKVVPNVIGMMIDKNIKYQLVELVVTEESKLPKATKRKTSEKKTSVKKTSGRGKK